MEPRPNKQSKEHPSVGLNAKINWQKKGAVEKQSSDEAQVFSAQETWVDSGEQAFKVQDVLLKFLLNEACGALINCSLLSYRFLLLKSLQVS